MPLRKPQQYFEDLDVRNDEIAAETVVEEAVVNNKRIGSPKDILQQGLPTSRFQKRQPKPLVTESSEAPTKKTVVESLSERIDTLAVGIPDNDKLWEKLGGIENAITSLQFDKLDRESVISLYEHIGELQNTLGSLDYDARSHTRLVDTVNETDSSIRTVNDKLIESTVSIAQLKTMVESVVLPSTEENKESIEAIKAIHEELAAAVEELPKKSFDPSGIIDSIKDLRETIGQDILTTRQELSMRVDSIPEVKYYEDDLDSLQNFITEVRDSIKYYDTDVDELKQSLLDLGHHLGKTISEKVTKLNKEQKKLTTNMVKADKKITETIQKLPEVKYYDDEIDLIENKIHNILTSIKELPEVKYYDEDVSTLSSALDKLNEKIDAIEIKDWTSAIEAIQKDVLSMQELQVDFDQRWEESAKSNPDILHPDNANFVTFDDMQKHYRIFLDRIQIQLETIGGGGAVRILDMDDLDEDIRRNPQDYDGEFLQIQYDPDTNQTTFGAAPDVVNDINDLDDVDTTGAEDGMVLVYIEATGKWEARVVQYIGVNIDANPDPEIQDYGGYS